MENTKVLKAFCDGKIIPLREVGDPIFSQRLAGDGAAIIPESPIFSSPCDGTVRLVFQGGHALVIAQEDGANIMIHIGINTVSLNGAGINSLVSKDMEVKTGDPLIEIDLDLMRERRIDLTSVILVMEPRQVKNLKITQRGFAKHNETTLIEYEMLG